MKTTAKRAIVLLMMLSLLLSSLSTAMADDDDWYTYTYSYWGDEMASPNAYAVTNVIYAKDVDPELGSFSNPTSIFTIDDHVFVCDTNNNRIVELIKKDGKYELVREIYTVEVSTLLADAMTFNGHVDPTLYNPTDIFVKKTTDKERAEHYGEYKGDPYIYPDVPDSKTDDTKTDDTKTDETAAPEDKGEEKSDETAADDSATATSEGDEDGEAGDGETGEGETGEGETGEGEGNDGEPSTPPPERKENIIKQKLDCDYDIFIADKQHHRVIHCDYDLNVISVIRDPKDDTLGKDFIFRPEHIVNDNAHRTYVQAEGVVNGLMEFDSQGEFTGYVGAAKVVISFFQRLWRKLQTKEQKNRSEQYVPTEYNNLSLDSRGFIYATISALDDQDIYAGVATPIRKLNSMGSDILIRNGSHFPMGDVKWGNITSTASGASKFVDVIAFENDTYCCLDKTRGKIFAYDFQGNLLYAFGNIGYSRGRFTRVTSMDNLDEETILVLDGMRGCITEFSMTSYGKMINEALDLYKKGYYDESAKVWKEILQYNGNFELAYVGIGRALLRQGEYKEAMKYFKNAHDSENYSKAFRHYREEVVEKYILYAVIALAVLIIVPKVIRKIRRLRKEIKEA